MWGVRDRVRQREREPDTIPVLQADLAPTYLMTADKLESRLSLRKLNGHMPRWSAWSGGWGRQREAVMRMEEEDEVKEEVEEMRSEWRREEPLAKPSLTGASASLETVSVSLFLLSLVALAMLPQN